VSRTSTSARWIAAVAFVTLAAVAGCSSGGGQPQPTTSNVASQSPSTGSQPTAKAGGLASVDPCTLIPDSVASSAKLTGKTAKQAGTGRGCDWGYQPEDPAQGFTLRVNIEDHKGLGDLNFSGSQTQQYMVGKYHAIQSSEFQVCEVWMGYSTSSSFDASITADDQQKACSLAKEFAQVVVQNLPQG
jgi:hypothetical protein